MNRVWSWIGALLLIASAGMAQGPQDWSAWNPEPMTLISPEGDAISNPPFLHWQGFPEAERYTIRLIGPETLGPWSTTHNFYTPEENLPPATYQIEVRALGPNGEELAPILTGAFGVPEPLSDVVPALNEIRRLPGISLLATTQQIEALQDAEGETAEILSDLLEELALENPQLVDLVEPTRYPEGTFDQPTWSRNNSLCFNIEDRIVGHTLAFRLTGERHHFDEAKRLALTVAQWDPRGATGVWENDHSAQALLRGLSVFCDDSRDELSDGEREIIASAIRERCEDLYAFLNPFVMKETSAGVMNDPGNNHSWFVTTALGLGGLALLDEDPQAEEWVSFASQMFWGMFFPRGDRSGGWFEGNDYWSYNLFFIFQFADGLAATTGIDLYEHMWLRHTALFKIMAHPPVGAYVPFGDCKHRPPSMFDRMIMMRLASHYSDPLAWRYVDAVDEPMRSMRQLVNAPLWSLRGDGIAEAPAEIPTVMHCEDMGWVISNTDPFNVEDQVIFAFRCGPFPGRSFGHTHADLNSFILAAGGEKLLWDAGYYDSYLTPHHRHFARLSDAHNTILINGTGQAVHIDGLDGVITRFEENGDTLRIEGDASEPLIYGGRLVQFIRNIEYTGHRELTVQDDIWARELSNISFLLHSAYPIVYNPGDRSLLIQGEEWQAIGQFETDVPVEAILRTEFPDPPNRSGDEYPDQFHLELRTVDQIERWMPTLRVSLSRISD